MARSRDRLAFARVLTDADIYRVEAGRPAQLVVGSTFLEEMEPRLSPDGRRLVFGSQRAGDVTDIWVSDADGSNPRQLTHGPGRDQGSPYWSPDGRRIAFDSQGQDNQFHIWMIDADGGTPRRITTKADDEHVPTWSRDGRWIYFSSDEGNQTRYLACRRERWDSRAADARRKRAIRVRVGGREKAAVPARRRRLTADGDVARQPGSAPARGLRQVELVWRRSQRVSTTCRATPAPIRLCMSWIWTLVGTGASAHSRTPQRARWVCRCRQMAGPSCIRDGRIRMRT